jgi:hypothetical protein
LRLQRALVGQEDARRATLNDRRRDRRTVDVGERLRGENDGSVLLAKRLQPFTELPGEAFIVEREPALVDHQQGGTPVEAIFNAMEEIGEDGRRRAGADKAFGLEGLDLGFADSLSLGVEQTTPGPGDGVGLQSLLQRVRLQENRQAGDGPFRDRSGAE